MTNKEICLKYQKIEEKAIKLAKLKTGEKNLWNRARCTVSGWEHGLIIEFFNSKNVYQNEIFITWEELNDKN